MRSNRITSALRGKLGAGVQRSGVRGANRAAALIRSDSARSKTNEARVNGPGFVDTSMNLEEKRNYKMTSANTVHVTQDGSQHPWQRIPAELRELNQWTLARSGLDKAPLQANGSPASHSDPSTWTDFETACAAAAANGWCIGFVLTAADPFCCIDFDVCNEASQKRKGQPNNPSKWTTPEQINDFWQWAQDTGTLVEQSVNGNLHIWVKAKLERGRRRDPIEIYDRLRYILVTGDYVCDNPIAERQEAVDELIARMPDGAAPEIELVEVAPVLSDDDVIAKAKAAENGPKFTALWEGRWQELNLYTSCSDADHALIEALAFWSQSNDQVRRLFKRSGLAGWRRTQHPDKKKRRRADLPGYVDYSLVKFRGKQAHEQATFAVAAEQLAPALDAFMLKAQRLEFKRYGSTESVALSTLVPPVMSLHQMLHSLVQVSGKVTQYVFRDNPFIIYEDAGMRNKLHGNWNWYDKDGEKRKKPHHTFDDWRSDKGRIQVDAISFDPRHGETCPAYNEKGEVPHVRAFNLWRPIEHVPAPADWRERVKLFLDHVEYLFPLGPQRERFLNWFAHAVQKPGERPSHHFLHITRKKGSGRGWLTGCMTRVFPGHVALDFDLGEYLEQKWCGELTQKLIVTVSEIREGGFSASRRVGQRLKKITTDDGIRINEKFEQRRFERNCIRWFICSNWENAVPLEDGDRRFDVVEGPTTVKDQQYYRNLYWLIDIRNADMPLFAASIWQWCMERDLSQYDPHETPEETDMKKRVIIANLTDEEFRAKQLRLPADEGGWHSDLIEASQLWSQLCGMDADVGMVNGGKLRTMAQDAGIVKYPKDVVIHRRRVNVWIVRNAEHWLTCSPAVIANALGDRTQARGA